MRDESFMRRAFALARRAKGNTSPNPMVGAVVVAPDGEVLGQGHHERAGAPHAEAVALAAAGDRALGATLYVTLEPCNHHGLTPPCTQAILESGVTRVVVAAEDVDERVRGEGIRALGKAGLQVDVGVLEDIAHKLNRMYFHHRRTGRPFVTLKMAQTLDGAVGLHQGEHRQLTGKIAAAHVRALRYEHDAVMVGVETALIDDPQLTVRPFKKRAVPYTRIVVDSVARLPLGSKLVKDRARAATIVAAAEDAPQDRVDALRAAGVDVLLCKTGPDGRVEMRDLLGQLGKRDMLGILCEGGPALAGALLSAKLVNELHFLFAPEIFGTSPIAPVVAAFASPQRAHIERAMTLGDDALIIAGIEAAT